MISNDDIEAMKPANEMQVGGDHYKARGGEFQHWDMVAEMYGSGYLIGCATKYLTRWQDKNGKEDLKKAAHYVLKLHEMWLEQAVAWQEPTEWMVDQFITSNRIGPWEAELVQRIIFPKDPDDLLDVYNRIKEAAE